MVFSSEWDAQRAIYSSDQERQLDGRYFEQIHRVFPFYKILPRVHSAHPIRGGGGGGECVTHSGSAIPLGKEITVKSSVTATLL